MSTQLTRMGGLGMVGREERTSAAGMALTSEARLVGHHPTKQEVTGLIPVRAHARVAGSVPSQGAMRGSRSVLLSHIDVSLAPFLPPFPLSKNK